MLQKIVPCFAGEHRAGHMQCKYKEHIKSYSPQKNVPREILASLVILRKYFLAWIFEQF